jgi:NADH:ubiquinone oxidoreductase subunit H
VTLLHLVFQAAASMLVLAALFGGTFFLLFCERFVHARTQHRDGPGRGGRTDYFQVWTDFRKVRAKRRGEVEAIQGRFRIALFAWALLPAVFFFVLISPILPSRFADAELPLLLLLPLLGAGCEALFLHATSDTRERYEWRKRLMLRIMGASMLYLSVFTVALRAGQTSLSAISDIQGRFPYHAFLASPGIFLSGLGAFASIFLLAAESPMDLRPEQSLHRSLQYPLFFVNKMWIFCLLCFWVFIFLGGLGSIPARLLFPVKAAAGMFLFTVIQASFPRTRAADANEITARWLLRLCLLGFLAEVLWVGVVG